jgi:mannose-6-phosphate isomerase-like protein (cupin superfamily)
MKVLSGGCRVYAPEDGEVTTRGNWTARAIISRQSGARLITQTVDEYMVGESPTRVNPTSEEAMYVASGVGQCRVDGHAYPLRPGTAVFVPPGASCSVENRGPDALRIVSVCCPEDPGRHIVDRPIADRGPGGRGVASPRLAVQEDERDLLRATGDREFRLLVDPDVGSRQVTQFVGWVATSKAPFHHHTYEEAIFILEGRGLFHIKGQSTAAEFGPGTSIYLPAGVVHCLENPGPSPVRLLGVFHPSGSPAAAYDDS